MHFIKDAVEVVVAFILVQPEFLPALGADLGFTTTNAALALVVNTSLAGGISTFIVTGSLKGAALAALQAGLFAEAGNLLQSAGARGFLGIGHVPSEFIAHGLVGGLVSEIGSGKFGSGFLAGGISSLAPVPAGQQTWEQTVEGSVVSAALGGADQSSVAESSRTGRSQEHLGISLMNACTTKKMLYERSGKSSFR